jgi:hypothetical protein
MNESKKIVSTETDRKLQVKYKCEVDGLSRTKNKVSAKNMMQMRRQEE